MDKSIQYKKTKINNYMFNSLMVYKFTYSFYIILILLSIPVQFVVIILLSHAMTLLQTRPYDLQWIEFIGEHAARWLKPFVRDTPWESGISVWNQFTYFPVCLIVSSFLLLFLKVVSEWCIEYLSEKVASDIRNSLIKNYLTLNFMDALKTDKGALGTRIAEDTHEARLALTRVLGSIPAQVLSSVFFITWLVLLDTQLFFLFVSILTPSIFIIRWVSKLLKGLSKQGLNSQSLLHDSLLEKLTHWQTIRTFGAYQLELERFSKDNTNLYKIWRRATRAKSLSTPLVEWLATMAGCCVIVVALKRISENALSQNAFTSFLVTVSYLAASLQEISTQITHSRKGAESWRRLFLFGLFAQNSQKTIFPQGEKNKNDLEEKDRISVIKLDNVQLENLNKNSLVTEDLFENPINLELKKGDFCAIYGPSGIGKTSFITALIGLTPIKSGHILWSTPHKILPLNDLNFKLIHYISQDPFLFPGTIFDNIIYPFSLDSSDPQFIEVNKLKASHALKLSSLDVDLQKHVHSLSGGEKQRVALARAFFHNSPVLIIDEGTSALDPLSEENVLVQLNEYSKNAILIMVTHRRSVLKFCTQSLELNRSK